MIDQGSIERILRPHHERLRAIAIESWGQYVQVLRDFPFFADDKTARANAVHAAARMLALQKFDKVKGVDVIDHPPSSFMLRFDWHIFMKVKKVEADLRPRNVPTEQHEQMMGQLPLPGHGPDPVYPFLGYELNERESEIKSVHVILPMGRRNLWSYEICDGGVVGEIIEMPTLFPLDDLTRTKVRPKPHTKKKDKKSEENE